MKYGVILCDMPHEFKAYGAGGYGKSAQRHYNCVPDDQLLAVAAELSAFAADDCALFFWTTWPKIFSAPPLIEAMGFKYSGLAWEWIKQNHKTGKYSFGGGYGTRKNLEPCLLARRGSPERKSKSERDFIIAARREHSRKPDEQYAKIEAIFDGPYLEAFATQPWSGWDSWAPKAHAWRQAAE